MATRGKVEMPITTNPETAMATDPVKQLFDIIDVQSVILGEVIGLLVASGAISKDALRERLHVRGAEKSELARQMLAAAEAALLDRPPS